jgi:hypothetical protein
MEELAERGIRNATGFAWMHEASAAEAKLWGDSINIASGVLGGIVGTSGITSLASDGAAPEWVNIITAFTGFLLTVLSVFAATWRPGEVQMSSVLTQVSYKSLANDLKCELSIAREDRHDAREFVLGKLEEIEQVTVSAPVLSARIRAMHHAKFKHNPLYDDFDRGLRGARAEPVGVGTLRRMINAYDNANAVTVIINDGDGDRGADNVEVEVSDGDADAGADAGVDADADGGIERAGGPPSPAELRAAVIAIASREASREASPAGGARPRTTPHTVSRLAQTVSRAASPRVSPRASPQHMLGRPRAASSPVAMSAPSLHMRILGIPRGMLRVTSAPYAPVAASAPASRGGTPASRGGTPSRETTV